MNLFLKGGEAISTTLLMSGGVGRWWHSVILETLLHMHMCRS